MAKKEKGLSGCPPLNPQALHLLERCENIQKTTTPIVAHDLIPNYKYKLTRWKDLQKEEKTYLIFKKIINDDYVAMTLRFSADFITNAYRRHKCQRSELIDFIRRRLCAGLKNKLGYVPSFLFVLEFDFPINAKWIGKESPYHLHGVIKLTDADIPKAKKAIKTVVFGVDFKASPMDCRIVRFKRVWNTMGWLRYIIKNKEVWNHIYTSQDLTKKIRTQYKTLELQAKKLDNHHIQ